MILILQLFKAYPNSVEEITEMIHNEKAKAECNYQTNPQVMVFHFAGSSDRQELVIGGRSGFLVRKTEEHHDCWSQ